MRVALDSNILIYLAGAIHGDGDAVKVRTVVPLLKTLGTRATIIIPLQVIGETFTVLRRHSHFALTARGIVQGYVEQSELASANAAVFEAALDLAVDHRLQFWDALILRTAAAARCSLLLSEDMQDGFTSGGVTVVNPLADVLHPRLAELLA